MNLAAGTKGMIVGTLNVVATAVAAAVLVLIEGPRIAHIDDPEVGVWSHSPLISSLGSALEVAVLVVLFGGVPGCLVGGGVGLVAGRSLDEPRWVRIAVLALLGQTAVLALGLATGLVTLVPPAAACTLIATLGLERWTREATASG